MLRKDVKFMLNSDWEPKVPTTKEIKRQTKWFRGRTSGSVRLAKGLAIGSDFKTRLSYCKNK